MFSTQHYFGFARIILIKPPTKRFFLFHFVLFCQFFKRFSFKSFRRSNTLIKELKLLEHLSPLDIQLWCREVILLCRFKHRLWPLPLNYYVKDWCHCWGGFLKFGADHIFSVNLQLNLMPGRRVRAPQSPIVLLCSPSVHRLYTGVKLPCLVVSFHYPISLDSILIVQK